MTIHDGFGGYVYNVVQLDPYAFGRSAAMLYAEALHELVARVAGVVPGQ